LVQRFQQVSPKGMPASLCFCGPRPRLSEVAAPADARPPTPQGPAASCYGRGCHRRRALTVLLRARWSCGGGGVRIRKLAGFWIDYFRIPSQGEYMGECMSTNCGGGGRILLAQGPYTPWVFRILLRRNNVNLHNALSPNNLNCSWTNLEKRGDVALCECAQHSSGG
jgi:hypothetical protein